MADTAPSDPEMAVEPPTFWLGGDQISAARLTDEDIEGFATAFMLLLYLLRDQARMH